ncbi:DUF4468 domain-containing protein [Prevotella sp. 10(H)]|uniref:DUF4468 domain-containing protein n=1 Tax=Prevotella sp. 10(H) TaxID=1158294 RepID=UPI00055ACD98|nr:DUF4468 domain-containing protein [Prevotella sp. 10(H)]
MKKLLLYIICFLLSAACFSQVVKLGENFVNVPVINDKVTFLKELPSKKDISTEENYKILKQWAIINYGKDPFISSVHHDPKNNEFIAKSRIELLLPANAKGIREKMIMRYRINGFLFQGKCVLEITDISYLYESSTKDKLLPRIIRAEDFITDKALAIDDNLQEFRINTRKSTLYFLNEISKDFESNFAD